MKRLVFPQLDGLRGLAALMILIHHFWPSSVRYDWTRGRLGVDIFFIMSGFLITRSLWNQRLQGVGSAPSMLKDFYQRRFWRIVPACYIAMTLALLMPAERGVSLLWHMTFLSNWYFILEQKIVGAGGHLWALAVEQQFYLAWPLVVLFLPIKRVPAAAVAMIVAGVAIRVLAADLQWSSLTINVMTPGAFEALGAGAVLAFWMRGKEHRPQRLGLPVSLLGIAGVSLWILRHSGGLTITHGPALMWTELNRALLLGWILAQTVWGFPGWIGATLQSAAARALGMWSYQIYLCHNFFFGIFHSRPFHIPALSIEQTQTLLALIATFAWSVIAYHLIEKPLLRYSSTPFPAAKVSRPEYSASEPSLATSLESATRG